MRKYRDFAFLQPKHWLGIGMMAALAVATLIYDARMSIGNLSASSYLCYSSGYRAFKPTDATFSAEKNNVRASTVLRPVANITLTKD